MNEPTYNDRLEQIDELEKENAHLKDRLRSAYRYNAELMEIAVLVQEALVRNKLC